MQWVLRAAWIGAGREAHAAEVHVRWQHAKRLHAGPDDEAAPSKHYVEEMPPAPQMTPQGPGCAY